MSNDNKKIFRETSRWLRVGFLTISVLGPVIDTLASRLRKRSVALRDETAKRGNTAYQQSQERLAATGAALADTVGNLRDNAYRQELLKRGSNLTENLVGRSNKLSQVAIERGGKVGRDLADRGNKATQVAIEQGNDVLQDLTQRSEKASRELAKRTERVSRDITKRGKKVSKEVSKRSQKAARELQKRGRAAQRELANRTEELTRPRQPQNNPVFLAFGFGVGLIAAGIAVYILIKGRIDRYTQANQQMHVVQNSSLNGTGLSKNSTGIEPRSASQPSLTLVNPYTESTSAEPVVGPNVTTEPEIEESATEKMPVISIQGTVNALSTSEEENARPEAGMENPASEIQSANTIPIDAIFLGVVSTKTYYPIETPLDTLPSTEAEPLEVIYFVTVDEAQAQGYTEARQQ